MGWFDNLWRRRQSRATETPRDTAAAREPEAGPHESRADELEDEVAEERDEVVMREPRLPPGTG